MKDLVLKGLRITVVSLALSGCNTPDNLYLDPAQPIEARVDNLMKQMTLQEKVAQMCQYVGLKHMQTAERDLLITEMEKSHAQGFYKKSPFNRCSPDDRGRFNRFLPPRHRS